jgi:hypothetical protein
MEKQQSYKNHVRWSPLVHFVLTPLVLLNLAWQIVRLIQDRTWDRAGELLIGVILGLILLAARNQALKVQDRVIRLEEKLRYKELLSADLAVKASQFSVSRMIALRFASDEELPELVEKSLNGELKTNREIKLAITNWRGDHLRA